MQYCTWCFRRSNWIFSISCRGNVSISFWKNMKIHFTFFIFKAVTLLQKYSFCILHDYFYYNIFYASCQLFFVKSEKLLHDAQELFYSKSSILNSYCAESYLQAISAQYRTYHSLPEYKIFCWYYSMQKNLFCNWKFLTVILLYNKF